MLIGTYHHLVFESPTGGFDAAPGVHAIGSDDLTGVSDLLAPGDHESRIRLGDMCVVVQDDSGDPVGLQWVNHVSHQDRHFGRLSRPSHATAYINQTFIRPSSRGRGYGMKLMMGTLAACHSHGIERIRLLVDRENSVMQRLCHRLDFVHVGDQTGLRVGVFTVRRTRRVGGDPR